MTDGDSPYTKVVSMYNSGTPPTMAILDTTDVIALAEEKALDLSSESGFPKRRLCDKKSMERYTAFLSVLKEEVLFTTNQ